MEKIKSDSGSIFTRMAIAILSLIFFIASVVFIIGPSIMAYALGANKNRYKTYGFSNFHALLSIVIGQFAFFVVSSFVLKNIMCFYHPEIFWYVVITSFLLNYSLSLIFYYLGVRKVK